MLLADPAGGSTDPEPVVNREVNRPGVKLGSSAFEGLQFARSCGEPRAGQFPGTMQHFPRTSELPFYLSPSVPQAQTHRL